MGRKTATECVFDSLQEAVKSNFSDYAAPFKVTILDHVKFVMTSSSANAVRLAAYALGARET